MQSFLWKIYLHRFLDFFSLIAVLFALFFSKQGLSPFQISVLISIWSISQIVFEVPMGVLADNYSRRNLMIIGMLLRAVGFWFWLQGGFMNYAIGFIFGGLKNALMSGTVEAFVYDELVSYQQEHEYEKVLGKMSMALSLGLVLSAIIGGLVGEMSFDLVLIASIFTTLLSAAILFTIRNVKAVRSTGEANYFQTLKAAVSDIHTNPHLLSTILVICVVFAAYGSTDEFWSLIYERLGLSTSVIGFLVAGVYSMSLLAGSTVSYFKKYERKVLLLVMMAGLLYALIGLLQSVWLLPLAFVAIYFFQIAWLKLEAQMQHAIKANQRATISSLKSLLFELIYMGFVVMFGFFGTRMGVISILPITAMIVILGAGVYGITSRRLLPE